MTPKPCPFCQQPTTFFPLEEMSEWASSLYFCPSCQAEQTYFDDDALISTSLYVRISNRLYRWMTYTNREDKQAASLWYINEPDGISEPGSENFHTREIAYVELIKTFDASFPSLTPNNVQSKIHTWLIFS